MREEKSRMKILLSSLRSHPRARFSTTNLHAFFPFTCARVPQTPPAGKEGLRGVVCQPAVIHLGWVLFLFPLTNTSPLLAANIELKRERKFAANNFFFSYWNCSSESFAREMWMRWVRGEGTVGDYFLVWNDQNYHYQGGKEDWRKGVWKI